MNVQVHHHITIFMFPSGVIAITCQEWDCPYRVFSDEKGMKTRGVDTDIIHSGTWVPDHFSLEGGVDVRQSSVQLHHK